MGAGAYGDGRLGAVGAGEAEARRGGCDVELVPLGLCPPSPPPMVAEPGDADRVEMLELAPRRLSGRLTVKFGEGLPSEGWAFESLLRQDAVRALLRLHMRGGRLRGSGYVPQTPTARCCCACWQDTLPQLRRVRCGAHPATPLTLT